MSLAIAGMGWVTPLGSGIDSVWKRLLQGHEASATTVSESVSDRRYTTFRVPESALTGFAHSRLRRASVISRFAAAAGLEALHNAGVKLDSQSAERTALIFAISNGGVIYTKRFQRVSKSSCGDSRHYRRQLYIGGRRSGWSRGNKNGRRHDGQRRARLLRG